MDNQLQEGEASTSAKSTAAGANPNESSQQQTERLPGRIKQHLNTLESLDKQHQHMLEIEQSLQQHLDELQIEEQSLREALVQSSTTLKEQRQSEMRKREADALARLEDALMNDNDSDSSDSR